MSEFFFEGSEKKIELVLNPGEVSLRSFGNDYWSSVVESVQAKVLSVISNERVTAYLLSESSLFVFDQHLIMITCGRTHLVNAVEKILERVSVDQIASFFYERKHEVFPRRQPTSFSEDIQKLSKILPGKAFRFGDEAEHFILMYHLDRPYRPEKNDMTLEILMHGVDEDVSKCFQPNESLNREGFYEKTQMNRLVSGFQVDDYFFDPVGYSLNAIKDCSYYTVHVTPQAVGSYVSFETNANLSEPGQLDEVIGRVLGVFRPKSVDIFLFQTRVIYPFELSNYVLKQEIHQELECGYQVGFFHYFQPMVGRQSASPIVIN